MIQRAQYLERLTTAIGRSPITALLGPRQAGKTTLARLLAENRSATFFDLESQPDVRRLQNPELALSPLDGLVIIDEIQVLPELFATLLTRTTQTASSLAWLPTHSIRLGRPKVNRLGDERGLDALTPRQACPERVEGSAIVRASLSTR